MTVVGERGGRHLRRRAVADRPPPLPARRSTSPSTRRSRAIDDAGLTRDDIDGIATYPGNMDIPPGFSGVGVTEVQDALRLELDWFAGGLESPGQLGSVVNAAAAVAAGLANHVALLPHRLGGVGAGRQGPGVGDGRRRRGRWRACRATGGFMQWTLPFGAPSAANWIGMMAQRHFHEFGTTREQLAQIALNGRAQRGAATRRRSTATR